MVFLQNKSNILKFLWENKTGVITTHSGKDVKEMKKLITLGVAILCVAMVAVLFYGCGNNTEDMTTTTTTENTTTDTTMDIVSVPDVSDGVVSDVSGENENGLVGDVVTDASEAVSEGLTDIRNAIE